jgi:flagellar basal-body rod protein FlgC
MAAQRTQMDLIAQNLANAGLARSDGSVFHAKTALLQSSADFAPALRTAVLESADDGGDFALDEEQGSQGGGVSVTDIVERDDPVQYRYDPTSPIAAKDGAHKGYIALPDVDPIEQMVALVSSGRAYDANVSMLQAAKQMDLEAADIGRA